MTPCESHTSKKRGWPKGKPRGPRALRPTRKNTVTIGPTLYLDKQSGTLDDIVYYCKMLLQKPKN